MVRHGAEGFEEEGKEEERRKKIGKKRKEEKRGKSFTFKIPAFVARRGTRTHVRWWGMRWIVLGKDSEVAHLHQLESNCLIFSVRPKPCLLRVTQIFLTLFILHCLFSLFSTSSLVYVAHGGGNPCLWTTEKQREVLWFSHAGW